MEQGVVWTSGRGCTVSGGLVGGGFWDAYDIRTADAKDPAIRSWRAGLWSPFELAADDDHRGLASAGGGRVKGGEAHRTGVDQRAEQRGGGEPEAGAFHGLVKLERSREVDGKIQLPGTNEAGPSRYQC